MNYEPSTIHWKVGDLVLHDADAKRDDMLMEVVGFGKDGRVRTVYVNPELQRGWGRRSRSRLLNPECVLHDPQRFGVQPPERLAKDSSCGTEVPK